MNKFVVVFTTTTAMVLLLCPNALCAKDSEIDFSVPLYADFTLQLPTGSGLPLNLDVVASDVVSLQAKSHRMLFSSNTVTDNIKEEQINKSCLVNINAQPLHNNNNNNNKVVKIIDLGGSDTIVVSIKFAYIKEHNCKDSSPVWQVVDGVVQTGGTLGKDKFKIKRVVDQELAALVTGPVYKIQSCPSNGDSCQDLGLSHDPVTASTILTTTQTTPLRIRFQPNN